MIGCRTRQPDVTVSGAAIKERFRVMQEAAYVHAVKVSDGLSGSSIVA